MIGGRSSRILRHQARLRGSSVLQTAEAAPRRSVDRLRIDTPPRTSHLLFVDQDRSPGRVVHADAAPRGSVHLVRDDGTPRALVQALRGYGTSRAPLGAAVNQLHVGDASAGASRGIGYQRVSRTARRRGIPVLGHERRPRGGQGNQAVPRASVVSDVRYQGIPRAERCLRDQRVPRAVQHVRRQTGLRDQTVSRASNAVSWCSVVIVRDQGVSRASAHLLVERVPRIAILISLQQRLVVDGLKGQKVHPRKVMKLRNRES